MKTSFVFIIVASLALFFLVSGRSIRADETTLSQSAKPESPFACNAFALCPFFDIDLRFDREDGPLWLRLTGRPGTKEFIKEEFDLANSR